MTRSSRKKAYHLRNHEVDPLLTYEQIANNPLTFIDYDSITSHDQSRLLYIAQLYFDHWKIDKEAEKIFLSEPSQFCDAESIDYSKTLVHPLKWFYSLVQTEQLMIVYLSKDSKLFVCYPLNSLDKIRSRLSLFNIYHGCKLNIKCNVYFEHVFTFDDYHSISNQTEGTNEDAMNMIDFIYRELESLTMMDHNEEQLGIAERFLRNDAITLKKHQVKTIDWMLKREQNLNEDSSIVYTPFHSCHDVLDQSFDIHVVNGIPVDHHERQQWLNEQFSLSGGILCDEMGIGKTICVLLTSLINKCPASFLSTNDDQLDEQVDREPVQKRAKADRSLPLACVCGKLVREKSTHRNRPAETFSICTQCSRTIHTKCYLRPEYMADSFLCPYCEQRDRSLLSTNTTLIIAPAAIIHQWVEEIDKHLDCSLKVYMYQGIVNKGPIPSREFLAEQDFVFCSYENLKKDIHHNEVCTQEHHSTRMQEKKYEYLVSPLLRLKFWRLALDEAQMVDSPNTPASIMARSLVAHHRWFVTGTPFHRSINDLEGILQYLFPSTDIPRHQIANLLRIKDKIFEVFLSWIMNFLRQISRRTSRQCLNDLPEQNERVVRLQFSPLERMYYNRIWKESRDDFKQAFEHLWQKHQRERNQENPSAWTWESTDDIDMNDVHFLSSTARSCLQTPLMKLRCLCDHPQVGAHGVRHNDPALVHYYNRFHYSANKRLVIKRPANTSIENNVSLMKDDQPFTMKDLLDLLTARELESGEDSLRLSLLNFNGLAGIYLIQQGFEQTRPLIDNNNQNNYLQLAIQTYEKVIQLSKTYGDDFHVDSFQLAHAYYNLSYALSSVDHVDPPISMFSQWTSEQAREEFDRIKQRYQIQSFNEMNEAWINYNEKILDKKEFKNDVKELLTNLGASIKSIENDQIDLSYYLERDQKLPFTTWSGFLYHIVQHFDKFQQLREMLLISIETLQRQPTDEQVAKMAACVKCGFDNDPTNDNNCIFCEIEPTMKSYNCSIQPELYSEKQIQEDGGTHLVYYINEILSKASMRSNDSTRQLAKLLRTDWNDLLKKLRLENSLARNYSQQLKHFYLSLDEMLQCTSRLEFYTGDLQHRPRNLHNRYRFHAESIDEERLDFQQQSENYLKQVEKHRQQFHYFQSQQEEYSRSISNANVLSSDRTKCPMCHEFFGDDRPNVCFFLCGHFFCQQCTLQWKQHEVNQRMHRTHLKCPICRREIPIHSLTLLQWRNPNGETTTENFRNDSPENLSAARLRRLMENQEHLSVQGRYGTKVDSIVSFILNLLSEDLQPSNEATITTTCSMKPPLKILVFSQFPDILSVLAISLRLNAISFLQFTSTAILQQFRQDPSVTVLLMTLGKGANGLNLTEAQHVILVEPQLHRSVEFQAIARVRRLGQRYQTFVYRFIVNDTAEEVVLSNSRTALTTMRNENSSRNNRAVSFADDELLYEITMARKIFYQTPLNNELVIE